MDNNFDKDLEEILLAISALPREMSKREYQQKLFDAAFPKIHEEIKNKTKTKREIVGNFKDTRLKMSYSTFLAKYDAATKKKGAHKVRTKVKPTN